MNSHPLSNFINTLTEKTFDCLILALNDLNLNYKENDDLVLIYYENKGLPGNKLLEDYCKSIVLDKNTLTPFATQYNKIIYNEQAEQILETADWTKITVQKCLEGTYLMVYNHNGKWNISTRRCLDSSESVWIKGMSYFDLFWDAVNGQFTLNDLNPQYVYHFVLVHYKNRNIVNYSSNDLHFKSVYHIITSSKLAMTAVDVLINDKVPRIKHEQFNSFDELKNTIANLSNNNESSYKITCEGYIIKVHDDFGNFRIFKIQTPIYRKLAKIKPNNSNFHQIYLELYQRDQLKNFLPFFERFNSDTIKRIDNAMKNISKEILDLYHMTRQKKNPEVYNSLSEQYRKIIYGLHGLYIKNRKTEFDDTSKNTIFDKKVSRSINVHDVYHYLKNIEPHELRKLFSDRLELLNDPKITFLNDCINTLAHSKLMYP